MKMESTSRLIAAAIGVVVLVLWMVLPVFTFYLVVPLYMINGYMLAFHVNQVGIIFLLFPLLMAVIPLTGDKKLSVGVGALNFVMCLVVFFARKALIVGGNLRWLFTAASTLISSLGSVVGVSITEANLDSYIGVACDSFLMGGIGLWLCLLASVIYIVVVLLFSQYSVPNQMGSSGPRAQQTNKVTTSPSKGYSHRT